MNFSHLLVLWLYSPSWRRSLAMIVIYKVLALTFTQLNLLYELLLLWKSRSSKSVRKEVRRTKVHFCGFTQYTLYWRSGKFLWVFLLYAVRILSERAYKQVWRLKYFLLQLHKREHFVLHIWDIWPIPTIRTTVRIVMCLNCYSYC